MELLNLLSTILLFCSSPMNCSLIEDIETNTINVVICTDKKSHELDFGIGIVDLNDGSNYSRLLITNGCQKV